MNKFNIYHSSKFDKKLAKFDIHFQKQVDNIENQLVLNPYLGKPLNVGWFSQFY